jgi:DNA-binding NarL/FixJ family response regulator
VLVLTAHEDEEYVIPFLEVGVTGYLPKTVGLNELLEAIRATDRGESVLPPAVASVVVRHMARWWSSLKGRQGPASPLLESALRKVRRRVDQGV